MDDVKRQENTNYVETTDLHATDPAERDWISLQKNPLLIDAVLHSLFTWVDYKTLKNCRLVARKWKSVGDWIFIYRSALALRTTPSGKSPPYSNNPDIIPSLFKSINQEVQEVRFSAFKVYLKTLAEPAEERYFLQNQLRMTQLEIISGRDLRRYFIKLLMLKMLSDNLQPAILNMDQFIGANLTKLALVNTTEDWIVSLEKLKSLRCIDLTLCRIAVTPGVKMAPKELKLRCCFLVENIWNRPVSQMNEFIDFNSIHKLSLCKTFATEGGGRTTVVLNWSDCVNIKDITLHTALINLDGEISPHKIELCGNGFQINGEDCSNVSLNHYLDSDSKIKKMILDDRALYDVDSTIVVEELEIKEGKCTCLDELMAET